MTTRAFELVRKEIEKAAGAHGPLPVADPARCAAILMEECGEVAKEVLEMSHPEAVMRSKHRDRLIEELAQVAAVCVVWIQVIDDRKGVGDEEADIDSAGGAIRKRGERGHRFVFGKYAAR